MIDLHLHSSASDGLLAPLDLVDRVQRAGIATFSVTDHDTVAALDVISAAAAVRGLRFVTGIEITAVAEGRDLHLLGYGIDPRSASLESFLVAQREQRRARIRCVLDRLASLRMPLDAARVLVQGGDGDRTIGRPHVARAMIEAGYVPSVSEAFDRWLGAGRPAFVPREGAAPAEVIATIHRAGGIAAMAHPGLTQRDALIASLAEEGLDALEVWHSEHDEAAARRYRALAEALGLLMTGGSDFHGDSADRPARLGLVGMPEDAFAALLARIEGHADACVAREPLA